MIEPSAKAMAYAHKDGVFASMDGLPRNRNPYATCSPMGKAWDEGWLKNEAEREAFLGNWGARLARGNYEDFET